MAALIFSAQMFAKYENNWCLLIVLLKLISHLLFKNYVFSKKIYRLWLAIYTWVPILCFGRLWVGYEKFDYNKSYYMYFYEYLLMMIRAL